MAISKGNGIADKYAARMMMVSFFLPMQLQVLVLFAMCGYFIFRIFQSGERPAAGSYAWAAVLGGLYLLYVAAVPFTPAAFKDVAGKLCEYRLSYLLLPFVFASISLRYIRVILSEFTYFIYGAVAICIIANGWFVMKYAMAEGGFSGVNHVTYRIFFETLTGIHPTYISMYLVLGTGMLLMRGAAINRTLKYTLFYAMLALLLPLLAKSPLIALAIMFVHTLWLRRDKLMQYKWMLLGIVLIMVLSYLFVPFVSQRVNEMAGMRSSLKENVLDNSIHERKMILAVDLKMVKQYWLAGCGTGRLMHLLKVRYFFYSLYYGRDVNSFDPHNEYFYQWISLGLAGILLFLSGLISHFVRAFKNKDNLYIYLLLIVSITFFTESVLATQHGLIFYSFFTSILFFNQQKERQTN